MTGLTIDFTEAARALKTVVERQPERAIEDCAYFTRTGEGMRPHCLIAHVLWELGLPLPDPEHQYRTFARVLRDDVDGWYADLEPEARELLCRAQVLQDEGRRWIDVLDRVRSQYAGAA